MRNKKNEIYGPNFHRIKGEHLAISKKCRCCGIAVATDAHHWAWPGYPLDKDLQFHDITVL
ncbi:MAG: hypothetical protein OXG15_09850, partial [Gammaproteobacteria bacterium]|nr:hypothetical protein [Gammaproteobacteria bacterium]